MTEFSTLLRERKPGRRTMVSNHNIWRTISIMSVTLTPLVSIVGSNLDELRRSSFQMILEPSIILTLTGVLFSVVLILVFRINRSLGNFVYLCLIPGLFLFFNFSVIYEALMAVNDGALGVWFARLMLLIIAMLIILMAALFHQRQWWLIIISVSAVSFFFMSCFTLAFNGVSSARFNFPKPTDTVSAEETARASQILPNVYYIIADGLTGPQNYQRLTGEPLDFLSTNLQRSGFVAIKNARSNYFGSASSIGSVFHLEYFRDEQSDFSTPLPEDYFPSVAFKPGQSPTLTRLRSMGMHINFSASWYSGCMQGEVNCIDDGEFNFNRLSLRVMDNSFASYLSTGMIGAVFPRFLRRKVDAIGPVTRMLSNSINMKSNQFTFIHHMQPHDPWYFDGDCRHIVTRGQSRTELYRMSVHCMAKSLEALVQVIEQKDADAIIVLQGDHGWLGANDGQQGPVTSWDESTVFYRSEITNFVRLPAPCDNWIEDGLGPVNTMRLVLACLENRPPAFLQEALFIPDYDYGQTGHLVRRIPASAD